jgi:hypothetical protein
MDFTISITDNPKAVALQRALDAYNASNPQLTSEAFLQKLVDGQLSNLVASYTVAQMDPFTWLKTRFTAEERAAIRAAALTDGAIADLCAMTDKASIIHFDDPLTVGGVALLESKGLIAAGRAAQILAL